MKKAADVMTQTVVTIKGFATVAEAVALMKEKDLRALVVEKRIDNDAYAMVTESDIIYKVAAYGKDPKQIRVYEIMTKPCVSVPPDLGVEYVARLFANLKLHRAPVVSDQGLQGIISLGDIMHKSDFIEQPQSVVSRAKSKRRWPMRGRSVAKRGPPPATAQLPGTSSRNSKLRRPTSARNGCSSRAMRNIPLNILRNWPTAITTASDRGSLTAK